MARAGLRPPTLELALSIACAVGCGGQDHGEALVHMAVIDESVEANPNNAISALFTTHATGAGTVRIEIGGEPTGTRVSREVPIGAESVKIPLLGLLPETDYAFRPVLQSPSGAAVVGQWIPFRSGSLPDSIVPIVATTTGDVQPGLTLLSPRRSGNPPHPAIIIDQTGRVVWYHEVSAGLGDFQLQPNGHLTASVMVSANAPYSAGTYLEWDALGDMVGQWRANGYDLTDTHELRLIGDSEALLYGYTTRTFDLSRFGGPSAATVIGDVLQRLDRAGAVSFEWNTFDHFQLDDADDFIWQSPGTAGYDFTHSNAIETLPNGDYLLSTRHLSEITRIDGKTGEIRWRMGKGKGNQFTFINDPKGGFWNMHAVRRLPDGHVLFIDNGNGHMPPSTRAVEYEIDEDAMSATLVWSFEPGIVSCCMGFAQRLANGNTLVNLGQDYRVFEVAPNGDVVWLASLPMNGAGFFGIYRASRIASLDDLR